MLEHIAPNLRRLRRARDLTQAQVARLAKISQPQLSAFENGLRPPLALVDRLAQILCVHPNELLKEPATEMRRFSDEKQAASI